MAGDLAERASQNHVFANELPALSVGIPSTPDTSPGNKSGRKVSGFPQGAVPNGEPIGGSNCVRTLGGKPLLNKLPLPPISRKGFPVPPSSFQVLTPLTNRDFEHLIIALIPQHFSSRSKCSNLSLHQSSSFMGPSESMEKKVVLYALAYSAFFDNWLKPIRSFETIGSDCQLKLCPMNR